MRNDDDKHVEGGRRDRNHQSATGNSSFPHSPPPYMSPYVIVGGELFVCFFFGFFPLLDRGLCFFLAPTHGLRRAI